MHEYSRGCSGTGKGGCVAARSAQTGGRSEAGGARQSHGEALWGMTKTALGGDFTQAASAR